MGPGREGALGCGSWCPGRELAGKGAKRAWAGALRTGGTTVAGRARLGWARGRGFAVTGRAFCGVVKPT